MAEKLRRREFLRQGLVAGGIMTAGFHVSSSAAAESKSEGKEKTKPESEERPQ